MPLPVRRAAAPHVARVRAAALAPGASHSGACVAVCLQPTTTTPTPHCPHTQFLTPGRRGTTTAAAAIGGGRLSMGVGSLLSFLPLSLPLWGVVARCRVDCVDAPCVGASPFPPTPSGVGLSCAASLVLRPPFTRVGREAACEVNNPHAALRWGAHTELLEASVRCRWVRTLCVCTAATVRAGESRRDLKSPLPLSSTSRSLSPSLPPSLSLSLSCRQLSHPLAMSMTVLEGQEHQHAPASSTGGTLIAQRC